MQELLWAPQLDSHLEGSGMSRLKQSLLSVHPPVYTEGQSHEQRDITGRRVAQCKGRTRQTTESRPAVLHLLMRNLRHRQEEPSASALPPRPGPAPPAPDRALLRPDPSSFQIGQVRLQIGKQGLVPKLC